MSQRISQDRFPEGEEWNLMWDDDTEQPYLELKGTDSTGAGTVFKLYISGKDAMSMLVTFSSD